MWCSTAWPEHEVEARVREGQALGVGAHGLDLQPEALRVGAQRCEHPGEMSVQVARPISPARSRLSVKYPVPAPISSERG